LRIVSNPVIGLEALLRDVNALKKLILMEGEGAENNTKAATIVTLTEFNVERLLVVILRKTIYMMLVTMLITPSVINQPLAASKVLKSFFNISLKLRLAPVELLEDCNLQIRISSTTIMGTLLISSNIPFIKPYFLKYIHSPN